MFIMPLNPGLPIPINPSIKTFPRLDPAQYRRDRNTRKEPLLPLRERGATDPRFSEAHKDDFSSMIGWLKNQYIAWIDISVYYFAVA
jgi:hypothetical protein